MFRPDGERRVPIAVLCAKRVSLTQLKQKWIEQAIELAVQNVGNTKGGPFGALVVREGLPEIVAIRSACQKLKTFQLAGCEL
jgi:tRNA(Arg) A34 adenosine deaminase TadA